METSNQTTEIMVHIPGAIHEIQGFAANSWTWLQSNGVEIRPVEMAHTHKFYTLRMIWNNTMPDHMHVGKVKLYSFNPTTHPPRYLAEAVVCIGNELLKHTARLPAWMRDELIQMHEYVQRVAAGQITRQ